jgi:hypothetical protein
VSPPVGAPFSFLPLLSFPLLHPTLRRRGSGRARPSLLAFLSFLKSRLMAINSRAFPSLNFPCRFSVPPLVMPAGHLWQAAGAAPSCFPSPLPLFLFKPEFDLTPSPLHSHHAHTRPSRHDHHHCRLCISPPPEETPSVKRPLLLLVFLLDVAAVAKGVISCHRFMFATSPGAPAPFARAPPRACRRRRSTPPQLLSRRQACFLRLWVVSITYPSSLVIHACRIPDVHTPVSPTPPPSGVSRRGCTSVTTRPGEYRTTA